MVDSVDSAGRVMSLEVVDSFVFEFHCRSSFDASMSKQGVQRRVSTSVLNKFIIGKEVFNVGICSIENKKIPTARTNNKPRSNLVDCSNKMRSTYPRRSLRVNKINLVDDVVDHLPLSRARRRT